MARLPHANSLLAMLVAACIAPALGADDIARFEARGSFEDIKENLVGVIEGRGLVISNTSHVGDMLQRTGADLGAAQRIYDKAEVLEFCSALVSRRMMAADPHQIVFCPFTIAIYTLPGRPGVVFVSYRRLPRVGSDLAEVERLLDGIVTETLK